MSESRWFFGSLIIQLFLGGCCFVDLVDMCVRWNVWRGQRKMCGFQHSIRSLFWFGFPMVSQRFLEACSSLNSKAITGKSLVIWLHRVYTSISVLSWRVNISIIYYNDGLFMLVSASNKQPTDRHHALVYMPAITDPLFLYS